jgi:hypothetical protein
MILFSINIATRTENYFGNISTVRFFVDKLAETFGTTLLFLLTADSGAIFRDDSFGFNDSVESFGFKERVDSFDFTERIDSLLILVETFSAVSFLRVL